MNRQKIPSQKISRQRESNQNKHRASRKNLSFVFFCQRGQQGEKFPCCPFLLFVFQPPERAWTVFWLIYLNYSTCFKSSVAVN